MADVLVRHGRNPDKIVKFSVNIRQVHDVMHDPTEVPLEDQPRVEGDVVWILEVGTWELDVNGDPIPEEKIHLRTLSNIDDLIHETIRDICSKVDWGTLRPDIEVPYVYWYLPNDGTLDLITPATVSGIGISTDVYFKLAEHLPSIGIDMSTIEMEITISGTDPTKVWTTEDITSEIEITGTPYDLQVYWAPHHRVLEEF